MKKTIVKISAVLLLLQLSSCKDKISDPQPTNNENEIITTLILNLTDSSDASKVYTLKYKDLNQNDSEPGTYEIPELEDNKTYFGEIIFLDETHLDADTISNEVIEEADDHQVIFKSNLDGFTVSYSNDDRDSNGYPLGLNPIIKTKGLSGQMVNLQITLYHLPDMKKADLLENEKNGSSDINVVFNEIKIK